MATATAAEQVLQELKTALEDITVANGYKTDIGVVEFEEKMPENIYSYPAIAISEIGTDEDQDSFADYNAYWMRCLLEGFIESTLDKKGLAGQLCGDIRDRLFSELPAVLGSLSRQVKIDSTFRIYGDESDPRAGFLMVIRIYFRTPIQDSFTLIP